MIHSLRDARAPIDRDEIHRLVDRLCDLREQSNPATCDRPEDIPVVELRGKDNAAHWAAGVTANLMLDLAGWAINHRLGRALDPDRADHDCHDHEWAGAALSEPGAAHDLNPDAARAMLIEWIRCVYETAPADLAHELREALAALHLGEVQPIIQPSAGRRRGQAYSLAKVQMEAVAYYVYLQASGMRLSDAVGDVAAVLGVSAGALDTWRYRDLPDKLGEREFTRHIEDAKQAGKIAAILRRDPNYAKADKGRTETLSLIGLVMHKHYEALSLAELRDRYRVAMQAVNTAEDSQ